MLKTILTATLSMVLTAGLAMAQEAVLDRTVLSIPQPRYPHSYVLDLMQHGGAAPARGPLWQIKGRNPRTKLGPRGGLSCQESD
jgi:hypothetical protein